MPAFFALGGKRMAGRRSKAGDRLMLEGGTRPRQRAADPGSWTGAKEKSFLEALADSCNVKLAAQTAGASTSAIYVRRAGNAAFRAAWDAALATGYAQLEMMMLERALHGVEKVVAVKAGEPAVMREYSDRVGLALLRMHRDTAKEADQEHDPDEAREAGERIIARLVRMREQAGAGSSGDVGTKAAIDRIGLIAWGLRRGMKGRGARFDVAPDERHHVGDPRR